MRESRREFIKKSACALGMVSLATQMQHFGMMSALAQKVDDGGSAGGNDYKALVCIFMAGGNDGNNTVIPNHNSPSLSNYAAYSAARSVQGLAIAQGSLLPINVPRMNNLSYGLHPSLAAVHPYWNGTSVKMAIVSNVGTLVRPLTKAQYLDNAFSKPYQLFSHSDQVAQSQTGVAGTQTFTGWGGRVADKMDATSNPNRIIPMITSISGTQLFTSGQTTLPMAIARANNTGPVNLADVLNPIGFNNVGGAARLVSFNQLRTYDLDSEYIEAASHITDEAMLANAALQTAQEVTVTFPNTNVGLQLKQVARLIKKRIDLNVNRQVFYVQLGSFDTHNGQLNDQTNLLTQLSDAVKAFYDELIVQGMQNYVTTFTLSDFSRTLNPAGSGTTVGSDHGWGNHMFVFGGAVTASDFYGMNTSNGTPYPTLVMGTSGPDDTDTGTGRGRWIPTTSVEQYAATLARWFGLAEADQPLVFPNLGNFATSNLGFMTAP